MKICQNCGAEVNDNASFCAKCGSKMENSSKPGGKTQREILQETQARPRIRDSSINSSISSSISSSTSSSIISRWILMIILHSFDAKDISDNKVFAMGCLSDRKPSGSLLPCWQEASPSMPCFM